MTIDSETNLPEAIDAALERIAELQNMSAVLSSRVLTLQRRVERCKAGVETLRAAIRSALETTGQKKIERPSATISLQRVPPSVLIVDPDLIPATLKRHSLPVPDKTLIKEALKTGPVPGVVLSNGSVTLAIRT